MSLEIEVSKDYEIGLWGEAREFFQEIRLKPSLKHTPSVILELLYATCHLCIG